MNMNIKGNPNPNMSGLEPFKKGYDSRREGNGRKPVKSIEHAVRSVLEKSPEKFFKLAGLECPKPYKECKSMLEAMLLNQAATALGAKKGNTLGAANLLLDRLYGKAAQHIKLSADMSDQKLEEMSDADLKKIIESEDA